MREHLIEMAVQFLLNPNVRGSPTSQKRSFLERKDLKEEEIEEAFQQVPEILDPLRYDMSAPSSMSGQVSSSALEGEGYLYVQQPISTLFHGLVSKSAPEKRFHLHWPLLILPLSILAASGAWMIMFIKDWFVSRFKSWIQKVALEEAARIGKVRSKSSLSQEVLAAAKAANMVALVSLEISNSKYEGKLFFKDMLDHLNIQVSEITSLNDIIQKVVGRANTHRELSADMKRNIGPNDLTAAASSTSSNFTINSGLSSSKPAAIKSYASLPPKPFREPWEVDSFRYPSSSFQSHERSQGHEALGYSANPKSQESDLFPWWKRKVDA